MYPRMDLCTKDGPSPMAFDPPCFSASVFFKNAPSLNLLQTADHLISFLENGFGGCILRHSVHAPFLTQDSDFCPRFGGEQDVVFADNRSNS